MGIWKDKETQTWKFAFEFMGKKFGGGGYPTKADARMARETRRVEIKNGLSKKLQQDNHLNDYLLGHPEINSKFDALKLKYHSLYRDPQNNLGMIFDLMMEDFELPVRFKDVKATARESNERKTIPSSLRMRVLQRDHFRCKLCGADPTASQLHVDHIVPVSLGGLTEERNLQTLCEVCNQGKGDRKFPVAVSGGGSEDFNANSAMPSVNLNVVNSTISAV